MIKSLKKMIFTEDNKRKYEESTNCHICGKSEFTEKDWKVRDHCHTLGKFRGLAHNTCNLKFRVPAFTPVFFHNISGCDAHLFVKNLGVTEGDVRCIRNNEEKYISFSKNITVEKITAEEEEISVDHEIHFLDSFKFMACALGTLVDNLDAAILRRGQIRITEEKRCVSIRLCGLTGKTERQETSVERGVLFNTQQHQD